MPHGTLGGSIREREGGRDANKETSEGLARPHCQAVGLFCFSDPRSGPGGFPGSGFRYERLWRLIIPSR